MCFFLFLVQFRIGHNGDSAVTGVTQHLDDNLTDLSFQFFNKLSSVISLMLDIAQLLFPDAGEFATLQQFFLDGVDQFDACGGGQQVLPFPTDIAALEKGLDNAGA